MAESWELERTIALPMPRNCSAAALLNVAFERTYRIVEDERAAEP